MSEKSNVRQEGELLVVRTGATLPKCCVRCGKTGEGPTVKFEFTWNPHGLKMGRSVTSLAAVATNRRGNVFGYYCAQHRPRVMKVILIAVAIQLVCALLCVLGLKYEIMGLFMAGGTVGVFTVGIVLYYIAMPPIWLKCAKIEENELWLKPLSDKALVGIINGHEVK